MKNIFFLLYSFAWTCAIPLVKNHKRLMHGYIERFANIDYTFPQSNKIPLLIYSSSGGEALLAQNFIKKMGKEHVFYCFSWTKEGIDVFKNFAQKHNEFDIRIFYTPFDKPTIIKKALAKIKPNHCYIIETEIWFGLLNALAKLNIPYSFVNARMTQKSFDGLSKVSCILKNFPPSEVRALSCLDLERFAKLFQIDKNSEILRVEENLKFESARELLQNSLCSSDTCENSSKLPIVLFASVRNEEQEEILYCIENIRKEYKDIPIIVCPKHTSSASFWREHISESIFFASENEILPHEISNNTQAKFFVWDVFGQLKQLYGQADIVFVGGSLLPLGGQNFIEPIAYGIVPYVGHSLDNFMWVFDKTPDLREIGLLHQISTKEDLLEFILSEIKSFDWETHRTKRKELQSKFEKWLN